ncbi:unnamed protein product [Albugo candida]|uniref:Uncharacterized protein n=1 Tax=Albugo candida TaxID=65357 RepID=A0A024GQK3_9STRA|nr:unnamed protein product [Albugo candida]|eukprot:CCI49061.1 unnamed protein product [Albugo candida]
METELRLGRNRFTEQTTAKYIYDIKAKLLNREKTTSYREAHTQRAQPPYFQIWSLNVIPNKEARSEIPHQVKVRKSLALYQSLPITKNYLGYKSWPIDLYPINCGFASVSRSTFLCTYILP